VPTFLVQDSDAPSDLPELPSPSAPSSGVLYPVEKRIAPRFIRYERRDLAIGISLGMIGAIAMIGICAAIFAGKTEFGNYTDTLLSGVRLEKIRRNSARKSCSRSRSSMPQYRRCGGILATAYAIGDVFSLRQSLHRQPHDAKGFYAIYFGLIIIAAVVVVTPGTPLGLDACRGVAANATVSVLLLANAFGSGTDPEGLLQSAGRSVEGKSGLSIHGQSGLQPRPRSSLDSFPSSPDAVFKKPRRPQVRAELFAS
jgi:hypothetical protein